MKRVGMCPKQMPLKLTLKVMWRRQVDELQLAYTHGLREIWGLRFVVRDRGGFLEMRFEIASRSSRSRGCPRPIRIES